MKFLRGCFVIFVLLLFVQPIFAEDAGALGELSLAPPPITPVERLVPGLYQYRNGYEVKGLMYMTALPLIVAGQVLAIDYSNDVTDRNNSQRLVQVDGKFYLQYQEGFYDGPGEWKLYAGTLLTLWGSLLYSHAMYDYRQIYYEVPEDDPDRIGLCDIIIAPWEPANVFNVQVLPVLTLTTLSPMYELYDTGALESFFSRESVDFLGVSMPPVAALGAAAVSSIALVTANAGWEELVYRGLRLPERGLTSSSLEFGFAHLPNMLGVNVSVEDTLVQTAFATAFGFYAGHITQTNNGDISRAMAFHFWNNVLAFVADYIADPDESMMFSIGYRMSF